MFEECKWFYIVIRNCTNEMSVSIRDRYFKIDPIKTIQPLDLKGSKHFDLQPIPAYGTYFWKAMYGEDVFVIRACIGMGWSDYSKEVIAGIEEIAKEIETEYGLKCYLCIE